MTETQRSWLSCALRYGGSFVRAFAEACFCADDDNFATLSPTLNLLMVKYPQYLRMEEK